MLTTPLGNPARAVSSANFRAVRGVTSAGFSTTVLPIATEQGRSIRVKEYSDLLLHMLEEVTGRRGEGEGERGGGRGNLEGGGRVGVVVACAYLRPGRHQLSRQPS